MISIHTNKHTSNLCIPPKVAGLLHHTLDTDIANCTQYITDTHQNKTMHTHYYIYLSTRKINKIIQATAPPINTSQAILAEAQYCTLAQLTLPSSILIQSRCIIIYTIHHHSVSLVTHRYMTLHTSSLAHMCLHS